MKAPHIQTSPTEPDDTNKTSLKEQKSAERFDSAFSGSQKTAEPLRTLETSERSKGGRCSYLWHVFLLSNTDKVFKHGHHRRSGDHVTVDQIREKTHLQREARVREPTRASFEVLVNHQLTR